MCQINKDSDIDTSLTFSQSERINKNEKTEDPFAGM